MTEKILRVFLQIQGKNLHPVSRNILTTGRKLGAEGGCETEGVLFTEVLSREAEEMLKDSGLQKILVFTGSGLGNFIPEQQAEVLKELSEPEIFLFPATPEGRTLSAMLGAVYHTGVTADCTALTLTEEGLLQTRPAFLGNRRADILTKTRPQIASLRFSSPVPARKEKTEVIRKQVKIPELYPVSWLDQAEFSEKEKKTVLVLGGGIEKKEDLGLFKALAEKLNAELFCSRVLVDRGWMPRSRQVGLSGCSLSAELLIALGVSGSLQFQAGLQKIQHLCAVDVNPHTPLMALADTPIQGDLYEIADTILKK